MKKSLESKKDWLASVKMARVLYEDYTVEDEFDTINFQLPTAHMYATSHHVTLILHTNAKSESGAHVLQSK